MAGMKQADFVIGGEFMMSGSRWRCTDVGTRIVVAIKLDAPDSNWYNGPPYAVAEYCIDENDMEGCEPV
jgi:hypothetical protein